MREKTGVKVKWSFPASGSIAVLAWKSGNMLLKEIKYLAEEKEEKKKNAVTTKKNLRM